MPRESTDTERRIVATNRRARYDYDILESFEAGIVLVGTEVKALRENKAHIGDAYGILRDGEVFLEHLEIDEYSHGNRQNHDARRTRKLLLHRAEIRKLDAQLGRGAAGLTLVPLQLYFKGGRAKLEIALARGRKRHDKRQAKMEQEARREIARAEGRRRRGGG